MLGKAAMKVNSACRKRSNEGIQRAENDQIKEIQIKEIKSRSSRENCTEDLKIGRRKN